MARTSACALAMEAGAGAVTGFVADLPPQAASSAALDAVAIMRTSLCMMACECGTPEEDRRDRLRASNVMSRNPARRGSVGLHRGDDPALDVDRTHELANAAQPEREPDATGDAGDAAEQDRRRCADPVGNDAGQQAADRRRPE